MLRTLLWSIAAFVVVSPLLRATAIEQDGSDSGWAAEFDQVWSRVISGDPDELTGIEKRLADSETKFSTEERLRLQARIAYRCRQAEMRELGIRAARRVLDDPAFREQRVAPAVASCWAEAANTAFVLSSPDDRDKLLEEWEAAFLASNQVISFRLTQLDALLSAFDALGRVDQGRQLAEAHLLILLKELPEYPDWLTLRRTWRIDLTLGRLRTPTPLRMEVLQRGSAAAERVLRRQPDYNLDQFSNLWHCRLNIAQLRSLSGASENDVLSALEEMSEFLEIQLSAIRQRFPQKDEAERIAKHNRDFHESNVAKVRELASVGTIPDASSLVGKKAPQLDLQFIDGSSLDEQGSKGNLIVLDFWAVWCGPCIRAFPDLRELHAKYGDDQVRLIGITEEYGYRWNESDDRIERKSEATLEEEQTAIARFLNRHGITFSQVLDDGAIIQAYKINSWPTTVLIDRQGVVHFVGSIGKRVDFEKLVSVIDNLVTESPTNEP